MVKVELVPPASLHTAGEWASACSSNCQERPANPTDMKNQEYGRSMDTLTMSPCDPPDRFETVLPGKAFEVSSPRPSFAQHSTHMRLQVLCK